MSITSTIKYLDNLRTECTHQRSGTTITTDAPIDNMGKGEKFSPTDLVATALSACMITVMGIKANASEISFQHVSSKVTKVMGTNPRRIEEVIVVFEIGDKWTEREKKIMENTAKTCPVANSLKHDVKQSITFSYI